MSKPIVAITFVLVSAVFGILSGTGILLYDIDSTSFNSSPSFFVWLFFVCLFMAYLPIVFVQGLIIVKDLWRQAVCSGWLLVSLLIFLLLFLLPGVVPKYFDGIGPSFSNEIYKDRVGYIVLLGGFFSLPAILALLLSADAIGALNADDSNFIECYNRRKGSLEKSMLLTGLAIGLGTLTTAALQNAVVPSSGIAQSSFPKIITIIYGSYFSLLLGMLYAPSKSALNSYSSLFIDKIIPLPRMAESEWGSSYEKRRLARDFHGGE